jgi:hypothetical protein
MDEMEMVGMTEPPERREELILVLEICVSLKTSFWLEIWSIYVMIEDCWPLLCFNKGSGRERRPMTLEVNLWREDCRSDEAVSSNVGPIFPSELLSFEKMTTHNKPKELVLHRKLF